MDCILFFSISSCHHHAIMVTMNGLSKVAHFYPIRSSYIAPLVEYLFMVDIVQLHGIPCRIIVYQYLVFTSTF